MTATDNTGTVLAALRMSGRGPIVLSFFRSKPKTPSISTISSPIGGDLLEFMQSGGHKDVKRVVFAGHGSFNTRTDAKYPKVRLPPRVTMMFWCLHGETLDNEIGEYVEAHRDINGLPNWLRRKFRGRGDIPEVVDGGSEIWNYRLTYPSGLPLGSRPEKIPSSVYNLPTIPSDPARFPKGVVGDRRYVVMPPLAGEIRDRGVPIIALLAANWNICDGAIVHWCACRSIKDR